MQFAAATSNATFVRAARPARRSGGLRQTRGAFSVRAAQATPFDNIKFAPIRESEVSRAMSKR